VPPDSRGGEGGREGKGGKGEGGGREGEVCFIAVGGIDAPVEMTCPRPTQLSFNFYFNFIMPRS